MAQPAPLMKELRAQPPRQQAHLSSVVVAGQQPQRGCLSGAVLRTGQVSHQGGQLAAVGPPANDLRVDSGWQGAGGQRMAVSSLNARRAGARLLKGQGCKLCPSGLSSSSCCLCAAS